MKIVNQTRTTIITEEIIIPKTLLDQSLGLLSYKTPTAMLFKTRFGIHTLGMSFPIDVMILNKENRVVALKEILKPNSIFVWNMQHETVLELPEGTVKKTKTEIGDIIYFK